MPLIGPKMRWKEGKLLHPTRLWKSPTRRRIPRFLIEDRALESVILVYIKEPWIIFEDTNTPLEKLDKSRATKLKVYYYRYNVLPAQVRGEDSYTWLAKPTNGLFLWGTEGAYFVKPTTR